MKKITLFFVFAILGAFTFSSYAQTLNQPAAWPNTNWTLSGTFTAASVIGDPTINATFGFDDDDAGNGSADDLQATSPVIDLSAASTAGETEITISGDYVYRALGGDVLSIEVYDADAMTWSALETFAGNSTNTDYQTCASTAAYTTAVLDISGFTATQLSGFQYRFTYADQGGWQWGYCMTSPTITSAAPPSCFDPSALTTANITDSSADLGWTENGAATLWNVEIVDITAAGTPTGTPTASGVPNPYMATGLTQDNDYEFYVQADCGVDGTSLWVGPLAFTTLPSCPDPSALYANVLATSVDLGWTAGGTETLWDIEIVDITAAGVATGTPTASGVSNPYNQTGLVADNDYEYYVRADCGVDGASNWVGPFAFRTACTAFTAPYTEDFEDAGAAPNCWSLGGDENWLFANAASAPNHTGNAGTLSGTTLSNGFFAVVDDSTPDAANAQLSSPFVDLSGLTTPSLSFYEISNNEGNPNATLTVEVWDGAAWNTVSTFNTNTISGAWELKTLDLSGLTFTGPAQARFSVADSGSFYDDIAIDDVTFAELPSCPDPSALTATNITDTSADLGWTENGTATSWNIEIVDITAGGMATGIATVAGVMNPYTATGLVQNNDYEYYVQSDCTANGFSNWVGPFAFTTAETCPTPSALTATNIMETSADLGWTENGAATLWNIELVDVTAGGTQTMTATASGVANPYSQTGLVGDNSYQFYVQADCGVDGTSAWAGPFSFATPYVAVAPDCTNGIFLDSGGQSGDYSAGENITYTICPDNPGDVVSIDFSAFSTENNGAAACYDGLTIYDGEDNTATTINPPGGGTIWCWDRDDTPAAGTGDLQGMTIISSDFSGCVTFVFTSDGSVQRDGWEAAVTCAPAVMPANDDCADAEPLTLGIQAMGTTANATDSGIAAATCGPTGGDQDVWFSFDATITGQVSIATDADVVAIYDACGGTEIACGGDGTNVTGLTNGATYFARVYNSGLAKVAGPYVLTISESSLSNPDFNGNTLFTYYPNPVKNTLTLNAQNEISNVSVMNMLGQTVLRSAPNAVSNELDMSNLSSGAYFVQVTVGNAVETVKVIKN